MFDMEILNQSSLNSTGNILGLKKSQVANLRAGTRELTALEVLLLKQASLDQELLFFNWRADELLFWTQVEKLQADLGYNDPMMASTFSIPVRNFRFARSRAKSLPWSSCNFFYIKFKIHPALWFCEDFDTGCLAKNIHSPFKSNAYLPRRFEGGGSKMRTLNNAFDFMTSEYGNETANYLRQSMQVPKDALNFPEKEISIRTFAEIHRRLRMFGAPDEIFIKMGSFNQYNKNNKRMYSQSARLEGLAIHNALKEFFTNIIKTIDKNVHFKVLTVDCNKFILETIPGDVFTQAFNGTEYDSAYEIGLYRLGHIKVIPTYFGFNELKNERLVFDSKTGRCIYSYEFN